MAPFLKATLFNGLKNIYNARFLGAVSSSLLYHL